MATNQVEMRVNMRENTNRKSDQYGQLYPYLDRMGTINQRGLCEQIASSDTIYGRAVIEGVTTIFSKKIFENLAMGVAVQLNGIGTFYPTLKSRPGGVASVTEAKNLGADNIVEGIHVRFLPDSTDLDNITSKEFKKRCVLKLNMLETVTTTEVGGKKVYKHSYVPIYEVDDSEPTPPEP